MRVKLSDIIKDHNTQCRAAIDTEVVNDYAERMSEGDAFPPVVLIGYGATYFIGDGWHRIAAAEQIGAKFIEADFTQGTREDAIKYALKANVANGLRRTNADKRRCVEVALKEFGDMSSRAIAEMCGVGHQMVDTVRPVQLDESASSKRVSRDGKERPATQPPRTPSAPSPRQTAVEREDAEYLQKETVTEKTEAKVETTSAPSKKIGLGVRLSNDAIAILQRIPIDDPLRQIGLQTVTQWIKANK